MIRNVQINTFLWLRIWGTNIDLGLFWRPQIPFLIYFIIIIVIVMPCILAWINTIKKKENIPSVFVFDVGEIVFCCNSSLRKYSIHWVNVYCNVILPPQLTCSIQMSIHFNSWKEQKTLLKYVNIYNMEEGESKISSHGKMGKGKLCRFLPLPHWWLWCVSSFVFCCCQLCHWGIREKEVNKRG